MPFDVQFPSNKSCLEIKLQTVKLKLFSLWQQNKDITTRGIFRETVVLFNTCSTVWKKRGMLLKDTFENSL